MMFTFSENGLYPYGGKTISWCDMEQQVIPLLLQCKDVLAGKENFFFSLKNAGGMNFYGELPAMYNITVNMDNPLVGKVMTGKPEKKEELEAYASGNEVLKQITDLALLANGMLKGKDLSDFIARSTKVVEDAYLK